MIGNLVLSLLAATFVGGVVVAGQHKADVLLSTDTPTAVYQRDLFGNSVYVYPLKSYSNNQIIQNLSNDWYITADGLYHQLGDSLNFMDDVLFLDSYSVEQMQDFIYDLVPSEQKEDGANPILFGHVHYLTYQPISGYFGSRHFFFGNHLPAFVQLMFSQVAVVSDGFEFVLSYSGLEFESITYNGIDYQFDNGIGDAFGVNSSNISTDSNVSVGLTRSNYNNLYMNYCLELKSVEDDDRTSYVSELSDITLNALVCCNFNNSSSYINGYSVGYDVGLKDGYNNGYHDAMSIGNHSQFNGLFNAIADTPLRFLYGLFNFDLFGMSMLAIVLTLLTGLIVFGIVKKFWK